LESARPERKRDVIIGSLAIIATIGIMVASIYYPFPNGQSMSASGFIQLWLRELLIVGIIIVALIFVGIRWLWQRLQPPQKSGQNAP
jgi:uncharacterized membrane protein